MQPHCRGWGEMATDKKAYHKEWASKNKERLRNYNKKWRDENIVRIRENSKLWRLRNPEKIKAYQQKFHGANPSRAKDYRYKRLYGLSCEEKEQLLVSQGGVCASCGTDKPVRTKLIFSIHDWHVDHSHTTGEVRGLLCGWCNCHAGKIEIDAERDAKVRAYLAGGYKNGHGK